MIYENTLRAEFISRPNRFIAKVLISGKEETVHVKNTGRCRELLFPGAEVVLQRADAPARKTAYDLISVYKPNLGWVNIDSLAPNMLFREYLLSGQSPFGVLSLIRPETFFGESRFDFYLEQGSRRIFAEVKGCTLEMDGIGYFPDAPTKRGARHLRELTEALGQGYESCLAFVITMPKVTKVFPNEATDPVFAMELRRAASAGVKVLCLPCETGPDFVTVKAGESGYSCI